MAGAGLETLLTLTLVRGFRSHVTKKKALIPGSAGPSRGLKRHLDPSGPLALAGRCDKLAPCFVDAHPT